MKVSLDEARIEVEEQKSNMAKVNEDVVKMRAEISNLKHQLEQERERNIKLEQYTRRENVRLLNVKESNDEDTKQVFREVLTEMGIEITGMRFHAVHRVGPQRHQRRRSPNQSSAPRHIIARFVCREDREYVWQKWHNIKDSEKFKEALFVPDLVKEQAQEGYVLRQACRQAREKYEMNVDIKNNKLVMKDLGLHTLLRACLSI